VFRGPILLLSNYFVFLSRYARGRPSLSQELVTGVIEFR
jgi:hypothetical protein